MIDPIYFDAAAKIIEEAEVVFTTINHDVLLPLADHLAFAAKRAIDNVQIPNPFIADIRVLFGSEYAVVLKCRETIEQMTGYRITDDEAGFIAFHIHSGLSDEQATDILKRTQTIDECILMTEEMLGYTISRESLGGIRLVSHLYYMIERSKKGERINVYLNDFARANHPKAAEVAEKLCQYMESCLGIQIRKEEIGFLAIHIQSIVIA